MNVAFIDQSGLCSAVEAPAIVRDRPTALAYLTGLGHAPTDVTVGLAVDFADPSSRRRWLSYLGLECFMLDHLIPA